MANYAPKFAHLRPRKKLFPEDAARVSLRVSTEDRAFLIAWAPPSQWAKGSRAGAAMRQFIDVARGKTAADRLSYSGVSVEPKHSEARSHIIGMMLSQDQLAWLRKMGDGDLCHGARQAIDRIRRITELR